ncbi:MAG TPA: OmpA family protein [Fermentimonas sp.]|nr:OmpA family protein [Fermentimonas sp.]
MKKNIYIKMLLVLLMLSGIASTLMAQEVQRIQPKFWIGLTGAANYNMYTGTTQKLNESLMAPSSFHDGSGFGGLGTILLEYRPMPLIGFMLNLGYDNRGGDFDQVESPCNCPEDLNTGLSYATIQPSIRISPFGPDFYVFLGAAYNHNLNKSFTYTFDQDNGDMFNTAKGDFSNIRKNLFSSHVGVGYDIQLASADSRTQVAISPFISYHPYFGQKPRDVESWSLSTVRAGMSFKFGRGPENKRADRVVAPAPPQTIIMPIVKSDVKFDVRAPLTNPVRRTINETFPLRNYIFFEEGSSAIPNRYVKLNKDKALQFNTESLRDADFEDQSGRSGRQLNVYNNILNVLGYRMLQNPSAQISLIGSSAGKGTALGKEFAESVKRYLVDVFGVQGSRIETEGRSQPINPSESPGGVNYLPLLRADDRRVEIVSKSVDMMTPLQIIALKDNPMDSRVLFTSISEKQQPLKSWNVKLTDENGVTQNFGPFTGEQESVLGNTILGNSNRGAYKVVMHGLTNEGAEVKTETTLNLVRSPESSEEESLRYSILFDFDKFGTVNTYEKFLTEVIAPRIENNSKVIISGHTDVIGNEEYNLNLSKQRASETENILSRAVKSSGKNGVNFHTNAFGDDTSRAPFDNKLPEERFYNRTVIIDIEKMK